MFAVKPKNQLWKNHQIAIIGISPANPSWSIGKAAALAEFARSNFKQTILCVSDSLYRHTLSACGSADSYEAEKKALSLGNHWLERFAAEFVVDKNCIVFRWNEWRNDELFLENMARVRQAFMNDARFQVCVLNDIANFKQRKFIVSDFADQNLVNFVLEEVAGLATLFDNFSGVELYCGRQLESVAYARAGKLAGLSPDGIAKSDFTSLYLMNMGDNIQQIAA